MFFASVSAIPWMLLCALAVTWFWLAPLWALFIMGYGMAALFLLIRWARFRKINRTSNIDNLASAALWALPFVISIGGIVIVLVEQFDGRTDIAFDCEYRPFDYIGIPIISAIWFGIALLYSALLTKSDWNRNKPNRVPVAERPRVTSPRGAVSRPAGGGVVSDESQRDL